ncbi:MAG: nucleoside hydrolase [Erysipelotrichaceae bacterium]|nr:nucleoside hydrolase [Erysipelotrichaceae bacterium]
MRKLIIDCDPGHDDIIAILVALAHPEEFDILGFTTVAGNQTIEKVTENLLKVEEYIHCDLPVAKGYACPLVRPAEPQAQAHGETGLDGPKLPETDKKPVDLHAIEFMKQKIMESDEPVTMLCLGPLTNMAMFIRTYPQLLSRIDCIALMGGGVRMGNMPPMAEFNIYHDPEAAKIVFDSGIRIVMAPLEVCYAGSILMTEIELFKGRGKASQMIYDIMDFHKGYAVRHGWDRTAIFDMTPVIYLMHPELFRSEEMKVDIETDGDYCRGMTVCDQRGYEFDGQRKTVLLDVDREAFIKIMFDSVAEMDRRLA